MRFHHELRYAAAPASVYAMLVDPTFRERVCQALNVTTSSVRVEVAGGGVVVTVDQERSSAGVPGFAKRIVGDQIRIVQREEWLSTEEAALSLAIPGKPAALTGSVTVAGDGSNAVQAYTGDLRVTVPMLGGRLEELIAGMLRAALDREQEVGRAWLAERG